jgi:hypothetical protein
MDKVGVAVWSADDVRRHVERQPHLAAIAEDPMEEL